MRIKNLSMAIFPIEFFQGEENKLITIEGKAIGHRVLFIKTITRFDTYTTSSKNDNDN